MLELCPEKVVTTLFTTEVGCTRATSNHAIPRAHRNLCRVEPDAPFRFVHTASASRLACQRAFILADSLARVALDIRRFGLDAGNSGAFGNTARGIDVPLVIVPLQTDRNSFSASSIRSRIAAARRSCAEVIVFMFMMMPFLYFRRAGLVNRSLPTELDYDDQPA